MGDIKEKVEMELKPYETMCEEATEHLKRLIVGSESAEAEEILTVAKVVSEIVDIKKDIVEMCYKKQIMEAMEENADEYGETWDEEGPMERKFYRGQPRDSRGRYMSRRGYKEPEYRMTPEMYREMDFSNGRMHYGNGNMGDMGNMGGNSRGYADGYMPNSRYETAKRSFTETKAMHNMTDSDDMMVADEVGKWIDVVGGELKESLTNAKPKTKTMAKQKLMSVANSIV